MSQASPYGALFAKYNVGQAKKFSGGVGGVQKKAKSPTRPPYGILKAFNDGLKQQGIVLSVDEKKIAYRDFVEQEAAKLRAKGFDVDWVVSTRSPRQERVGFHEDGSPRLSVFNYPSSINPVGRDGLRARSPFKKLPSKYNMALQQEIDAILTYYRDHPNEVPEQYRPKGICRDDAWRMASTTIESKRGQYGLSPRKSPILNEEQKKAQRIRKKQLKKQKQDALVQATAISNQYKQDLAPFRRGSPRRKALPLAYEPSNDFFTNLYSQRQGGGSRFASQQNPVFSQNTPDVQDTYMGGGVAQVNAGFKRGNPFV